MTLRRFGSIGSSLINIGEEVKVGNEPEHAVAAAAGNLGENTRILFGAAAGFGFALQTAVTKDFVTEIGGGVVALLADWSVYVLIVSAARRQAGNRGTR